ncbi:ATP-binding protein [uncultured Tateyamaria sp.]|uniref:ATP-binding protein n=1 Tax=uncultured Tateyamaria sp. TaxID=455651 RepID=UPI002632984C|nr:ATP-binding protein [uncultured Tateyamaria sp.]
MTFQWLKRYMPRGIYARAALILMLPVVFVQLVVSVVFVSDHFEDVTRQMSNAAAREVRLVLSRIARESSVEDIAISTADVIGPLSILLRPVEDAALGEADRRQWYDFSGIVITQNLRRHVPELAVVDLSNDRVVRLILATDLGPVEMQFDRRRVSAAAPHQLLVNMVFFSILITFVAFIYMRNQLRPIKRLARAAEAFGRGHAMSYVPAGATEVRAAGTAFVDMRNRIERQIETRTLMLSGVSHDLRTPLTRMRLALSMLEDEDRIPLERDVDDMQEMIDAFLSFAKGDSEGEPEKVDPIALARGLVESAQRAGQPVTLAEVEGDGEGTVMLRVPAMRRALDNLITNAVRYGQRAEVSVRLSDKSLRFRVEDAGPGIPESQRADAQRPFVRLDPSRNQNQGSGVGLGLAIATDIARSHGGVLRLGHSDKLGGLRADIVIAR